jgi:hypothetical protein
VRKVSNEETHSQTKDIYHSLFRWSGRIRQAESPRARLGDGQASLPLRRMTHGQREPKAKGSRALAIRILIR